MTNFHMKNVHNSNKNPPSSTAYQPIIDRNPNDYSTINIALLQCIKLEKPNYAVITFDLPIWLKTIDLILIQRMLIIPRLGDFHLMKSYFAIFGVIFADSELHDLIKFIYDCELAADSILNGNSFEKAIQAHFLINVAISQHVIPASIMKTIILDCSKNHIWFGLKDIPMVERFRSKIKNVFAQLDNAGRTHYGIFITKWLIPLISLFVLNAWVILLSICLALQIGCFARLRKQGILVMPKQHA